MEKMSIVSFKISDDLRSRITALKYPEESISSWIRQAVREKLEKEEQEEK